MDLLGIAFGAFAHRRQKSARGFWPKFGIEMNVDRSRAKRTLIVYPVPCLHGGRP
jgi:hypothetical protein